MNSFPTPDFSRLGDLEIDASHVHATRLSCLGEFVIFDLAQAAEGS